MNVMEYNTYYTYNLIHDLWPSCKPLHMSGKLFEEEEERKNCSRLFERKKRALS